MNSANTESRRHAAVIILLHTRPAQGPCLLLTERAAHLHSHGGEVAFPGGMFEEADKDLWQTALREAREEVGLLPESVSAPRTMARSSTRRGIAVTPFAATWLFEHPLTLCSEEIASSFWLPLSVVAADKRVRTDIFLRDGQEFWAPVYRHEGYLIWGFTARLLVDYWNRFHGGDIGRGHSAPVARFK
jgi:8-oxo-dGTP pyrophosphatase MutT (NUDIX family)